MKVSYSGLIAKMRVEFDVTELPANQQITIVEDIFRRWFETGEIDGGLRVQDFALGLLDSLNARLGPCK